MPLMNARNRFSEELPRDVEQSPRFGGNPTNAIHIYKALNQSSLYNRNQNRTITPVKDEKEELSISSTRIMNDGRKIPLLGLGAHDIHSKQAVLWALESGYRLIDTASRYHNEQSVGEAVRCSNIPRCEIYVVTKVYFTEHGYKETMDAFYKSLTRLGLGYVDLYLIHFPVPSGVVGSWQAMIDLRSRGLIRSIGVSNFNIQHLEALRQQTGVVPAVNQIEVHPFLQMKELTQYCKRHNITIQAFSPLTKGEKLCDPILSYVAKKYNKTTAQILVRWSLQKGYACIPKSAQLERIKENAKVFDFSIDMADMELIDGLEENYRTGRDKILWPWEG